MPHSAAGKRIDPPVSVPSAAGVSPAATAAPDPLEEPPVKCPMFQGLRAGGQGKSKDGPPCANSCVASLPSSTPPASWSRATAAASCAGTVSVQHPGMARGADAGGAEDVLERERHPVEHAAPPAGPDLRLRRTRLRQGVLGGRQQESIELGIKRLHAVDERLRQLDRRHLPPLDEAGRLDHAKMVQVRGAWPKVIGT